MLEQWLAVTTILLGQQERDPAVFELATLLEAADKVNSRLRSQASVQQYTPEALIRLMQTEFNKIFQQVFAGHLLVLWPHFTPLTRTLTTGHCHPGTVTMPGGFHPKIPCTKAPPINPPPQCGWVCVCVGGGIPPSTRNR